MRFLFATVAVVVTAPAVASASETLLDIPSGNQDDIVWSSSPTGLSELDFDISHEFIAFSLENWATPGNVYAWDWNTNTSRIGTITFDADEDTLISINGFDLSGWGQYADSAAWVRVVADGETVFEESFFFDGNLGTADLGFDFGYASQFQIQLENIGQWASVGIDNIEIGSMSVPAPGALALLGLAGIVGNRRRG